MSLICVDKCTIGPNLLGTELGFQLARGLAAHAGRCKRCQELLSLFKAPQIIDYFEHAVAHTSTAETVLHPAYTQEINTADTDTLIVWQIMAYQLWQQRYGAITNQRYTDPDIIHLATHRLRRHGSANARSHS